MTFCFNILKGGAPISDVVLKKLFYALLIILLPKADFREEKKLMCVFKHTIHYVVSAKIYTAVQNFTPSPVPPVRSIFNAADRI